MPLISICIPAYKNAEYLKRLLESISIQTFKDFEVIISDDSPDDSLNTLIKKYRPCFKLLYYKNLIPFGTPANWNFAISKASGEWIKIMHDDDWFADVHSLEIFANATLNSFRIIKCAYKNIYAKGKNETIFMSQIWKKQILKQPMCLMANNIIGPPSVLLIHSSIKAEYDERLKWRVDQEFYVRILEEENDFTYISLPLINVGMNEEQVTNSCFNNPWVELPEGLILLQKHGVKPLKNILVYDAWWRLFRNLNIRSPSKLYYYSINQWPQIILKIISDLKKISPKFLKNKFASKTIMLLSYLKNFQKISKS